MRVQLLNKVSYFLNQTKKKDRFTPFVVSSIKHNFNLTQFTKTYANLLSKISENKSDYRFMT